MSGRGGRKEEERRAGEAGERERDSLSSPLRPSVWSLSGLDEGRFSFPPTAHDKLPMTSSQRKAHPKGILCQIPGCPRAQPNYYAPLAFTDAHALLSKEKNVLENRWR